MKGEIALNNFKTPFLTFSFSGIVAFGSLFYLFNPGEAELAAEDGFLDLSADYITYEDLDDLHNDADLIIKGKANDNFENREFYTAFGEEDDLQDFHTKTEVDIDKVIKGSSELEGESITATEPIVYLEENDVTVTTEGYTELQEGSEYVIFLNENNEGDYSIIFNNRGKYNLDGTDELDILSSTNLEEVDGAEDIDLTIQNQQRSQSDHDHDHDHKEEYENKVEFWLEIEEEYSTFLD